MPESMKEQVICHSGWRYGERPLRFVWEGEELEIAAILRQWRMPEGLCFRVLTPDERRFDLFYLETENEWRVVPHS